VTVAKLYGKGALAILQKTAAQKMEKEIEKEKAKALEALVPKTSAVVEDETDRSARLEKENSKMERERSKFEKKQLKQRKRDEENDAIIMPVRENY
jgi:hypothetical protein